jgi:RNA polymerase sigma-70 factor (ECF subfamily)
MSSEYAERGDSDDRAAFRTAYKAYQPKLERFVVRRVPDPAEAEEICQETWLGYFRRFEEYQEYGSPAAPLFVIANHKISDWYRKRPDLAVDLGQAAPSECSIVDRLERAGVGLFARAGIDVAAEVAARVDVARAVWRLTLRQQQAVELYLFDDLDQVTVARLMGISTRAVKLLIARAMMVLRQTTDLAEYERRSATNKEVRSDL